jgi:excisionase family DNA binding protein
VLPSSRSSPPNLIPTKGRTGAGTKQQVLPLRPSEKAGSQLLSRSRSSGASRWHVLSEQMPMNCARLRLNAETTTIFVHDGWLIIEAAEAGALQGQLSCAHGDRLLTVREVAQRTGFTAGAVRDWIKRSVLAAVRVRREYRVREADLAKLLDGKSRETMSISKRVGRRRKAISV